MPRIKFSTLVSAVAGKSNGSVFSKNTGGAYFRTNKSGFALKTNAQSANQARFKSVARGWADLTDAQRAAWTAAVSNYPTNNIFGDERKPTGYELFCRINGSFAVRGMEQIREPEVPTVIPALTTVSWDTPDLFLYQNPKVISNGNAVGFQKELVLTSEVVNASASSNDFRSLFFTIKISPEVQLQDFTDSPFVLEYAFGDGSMYYRVSLVNDNNYGCAFELYYECATGFYRALFPVQLTELKQKTYVGVQNISNVAWGFGMSVNGHVLSRESVTENGAPSAFMVEAWRLSLGNSTQQVGVTVYNLSAYSGVITADNEVLASYGYVLPDVSFILAIGQTPPQCVDIYGYAAAWENVIATYNGAVGGLCGVLLVNDLINTPAVFAEVSGGNVTGFVIDFQTTSPVSSGVGLKSADSVKVYSAVYEETMRVDLHDALQAKWGYFGEGSDFNIFVRLFEERTGVNYLPVNAEKPKKKPRFKAGTDLSSTVGKKPA